MNNEDKLMIMSARLKTLQASPKNFKCPGVVRKLSRKVRNLSKEV